jgi:hypothetical protein
MKAEAEQMWSFEMRGREINRSCRIDNDKNLQRAGKIEKIN